LGSFGVGWCGYGLFVVGVGQVSDFERKCVRGMGVVRVIWLYLFLLLEPLWTNLQILSVRKVPVLT
jgi:hypothetical protein